MANREKRNKDYESLATMGTGGSSKLQFPIAIDMHLHCFITVTSLLSCKFLIHWRGALDITVMAVFK